MCGEGAFSTHGILDGVLPIPSNFFRLIVSGLSRHQQRPLILYFSYDCRPLFTIFNVIILRLFNLFTNFPYYYCKLGYFLSDFIEKSEDEYSEDRLNP